MLTNVYIFVYTYSCNDMRSVMLQINEYDDDDIFTADIICKTSSLSLKWILL